MLPALLAINIVVWLVALAYLLKLVPALAKRWNLWAALTFIVLALAVSIFSHSLTGKLQVQAQVQKHYLAGIDEKNRGNLQAAEEEFQKALAIQPGNPQARQELAQVQQQKPAESHEQQKATQVAPAPPPAPGQNAPPGNAPAPRPGTPGEKPKPAPHKVSPFEITHYALDVRIQPSLHALTGAATIQVRSRGGTVAALDFSLNDEFQPTAATFNGAPAKFTHVNDLLTVNPAAPLPASGTGTVTVAYKRTKTQEPEVGNGEALISDTGCYFLTEARWYPATGELDFRSPVTVSAWVPKGFTVVSVGQLKEKRADGSGLRYRWETDRFASMVSLAAARYVQQSVEVPLPLTQPKRAPLRVTCYTFPQHKDRAAAFLKEAASITRFFERRFGAYPYEKLGVVEIPLFPGGYGTTSFVMLIDKSFELQKVDREFIAHEIAHQWWGNSVFPQGLGAAWLTEAFANYSAWMYLESITANPRVLQKRVAQGVAEYYDAIQRKGDQPLYETDPYQQVGASQQILYEKGAVVLHMLRHEIGDRVFLQTLRTYAEQYRFGKAKIEDFAAVAERVSGRKLDWFFQQWLGRTGGMELAYRLETRPAGPDHNDGVLTITQKTPQPYRARMKVVLQVDNSVVTREIELSQPEQTFTFPVKGKVSSVLFDPGGVYLMKPPQWITG